MPATRLRASGFAAPPPKGCRGTILALVGLTAIVCASCAAAPATTPDGGPAVSPPPGQPTMGSTAPPVDSATSTAAPSPPDSLPTITVLLERRVVEADPETGWIAPRERLRLQTEPIANAPALWLDCATFTLEGVGATDGEGRVTRPAEIDTDACLAVVASSTLYRGLSVQDCPLDECTPATWAVVVPTDVTTWTLPADHPAAGAFAIRNTLDRGLAWVTERSVDTSLPALSARWAPSSDTACGTSCFDDSQAVPTLYVLGLNSDSDEFDEQILLHELGHWVWGSLFGRAGAGGFHDGSPTNPALAWGEGWATGFALAVTESDTYIDSDVTGGAVAFYRDAVPGPGADAPARSELSEETVAHAVWQLLVPRADALDGALWRSLEPSETGAWAIPRASADLVSILHALASDASLTSAVDDLRLRYAVPAASDPPKGQGGGPAESPITPGRIEAFEAEEASCCPSSLAFHSTASSCSPLSFATAQSPSARRPKSLVWCAIHGSNASYRRSCPTVRQRALPHALDCSPPCGSPEARPTCARGRPLGGSQPVTSPGLNNVSKCRIWVRWSSGPRRPPASPPPCPLANHDPR
jgi:hypothetical protein